MNGVQTGVYEVFAGVPDLDEAQAYWASFGFAPGPRGVLESQQAEALYGVPSRVESVRLNHQQATAGLIRLMKWDRPIGAGIGRAPMRATGCRWSVQKSHDLSELWNHAEVAIAQGMPLTTDGPLINRTLSGPAAGSQPFHEKFAATRNLKLFHDHYQQVVMQRFHIDVSRYGTINPECLFRTSEICHVAQVLRTADALDFYARIGFRRSPKMTVEYDPDSVATKMFDLLPGERLTEVNFENPGSGSSPGQILAGRLRVFHLESESPDDNRLSLSRPGHLGFSCYSGVVGDIELGRAMARDAGASDMSEVIRNEFGEYAVGFDAPDGYAWQLVELDV